jgi:hypothetical protein
MDFGLFYQVYGKGDNLSDGVISQYIFFHWIRSIFVKLFLILVLHLRQFFIVRIFVKRATGSAFDGTGPNVKPAVVWT